MGTSDRARALQPRCERCRYLGGHPPRDIAGDPDGSPRRHGPPIMDRVQVDRIIADRGGVVSMLGTERANGAAVVVKELACPGPLAPSGRREARRVDPADPADGDRVDAKAWTRTLRPFLEGTPLDEVIAHATPPWERTLGIAIDVLRALDTLHSRGSMHGAVKPRNIVVDRAAGAHGSWTRRCPIRSPGRRRPERAPRSRPPGICLPEQSGLQGGRGGRAHPTSTRSGSCCTSA